MNVIPLEGTRTLFFSLSIFINDMTDGKTCEVQTTLALLTKCTKVCVLADSRKLYSLCYVFFCGK